MKKEFDFLVTDSRYKHSLAIIRSLGKEGFKVATCSEGFSPTIFSRYSKKHFSYSKENFKEKMLAFLKENNVKLVLPVGYFSNRECSQFKDEILKLSNIILDNHKKILKVSDKQSIRALLDKSKMVYPKTWVVKDERGMKDLSSGKYVIKSALEEKGKKIDYANSFEELEKLLIERKRYGPQIIQEYIKGKGRGFFAFCENGKVLQSFQHERIRQYPESGGVSSCAESIHDPKLDEISKNFLRSIKWTGPVMLEYIYDPEKKKYFFIEMNAKFWGSYDLSVAAGLNFARIPFDMAHKKKVISKKYAKGVRFQWVLPEDTLRIKTSKNKKKAIEEWKKDFFDRSVKKDTQYIFNDPLPTILRILSTMWRYLFSK